MHNQQVSPDSLTLLAIVQLCSTVLDCRMIKQAHGFIIRHNLVQLNSEPTLGNAVIDAYTRHCNMYYALKVFEVVKRNVVTYNSIISGYMMCGLYDEAHSVFNNMPEKDITSWNLMIRLYSESGCHDKAISLLRRIIKDEEMFEPIIRHNLVQLNSEPTLGNAVIDAYTRHCNMYYALKVFEVVKRNVVTYNSIISGYMMCGLYDEAHSVFNNMPEKDITSWNLMIRLYSESGCHDKAISLLRRIIKDEEMFEPDSLTVMSLLPLCSQMASVHLLRQCHGYVVRACFTDPYLIAAMLDVYSKCGSINYAYKLFKSTNMKDLVIFTAMIGGYAMNGMAKDSITIFTEMLAAWFKTGSCHTYNSSIGL
ncbi:putative pentatricopeptide repeat-containing protein At5g08490 [Impatiens glandulifera]|uniref:putative pentatricopeptide repeat-containing protein At5g08490 n=1 Tax=Impatiens glandulifera TaxID=253017 RepID=UPI001FB16E93|nr:putative pentatricopeptide repeat-containing protein At5g08490 [Impatiens glandulifera]